MARPSTRDEAKSLVDSINRMRTGPISKESIQSLPDEERKGYNALVDRNERLEANFITEIALKLYSSKARFIFELLQNTEDNEYSIAKESGEVPYVSFNIYEDKIICRCNEDGFTNEDFRAICSDVDSPKKGQGDNYIGEKGIGFKSVFMVAWRVQVQSGYLSFYFEHRKNDRGTGMITPKWFDPEINNDPRLTQMTLQLHDEQDPESTKAARKALRKDFEDLDGTFLLFMKKLRKFTVYFHDVQGAETSATTYELLREPDSSHAKVRKTLEENGTTTVLIQSFHVATHLVCDLPKNTFRQYNQLQENEKSWEKSEVVLAFPLSSAMDGTDQGTQQLFCFLPIEPTPFKFAIHADFEVSSSRESTVESRRNERLLTGIADAFIEAIQQLSCRDGSAWRFEWVRFLPDKNKLLPKSLWIALVDQIKEKLSRVPVVYDWKDNAPRMISDLLRLDETLKDEDGQPLFSDNDPVQVISHRYTDSDLNLLSEYGLRDATLDNVVKWLKQDLEPNWFSPVQPKMRARTTPEAWHTSVATYLNDQIRLQNQDAVKKLRDIALLPTQNMFWVAASSGPVYFAKIGELLIPKPLPPGIQVISEDVRNTARLQLFRNLGVRDASIALVRKEILAFYEPQMNQFMTLDGSRSHLHFLYLSEHLKNDDEPSYRHLKIQDRAMKWIQPSNQTMFVKTDEPYGPWKTLGVEFLSSSSCSDLSEAPETLIRQAAFVHDGYFRDCPHTPKEQRLTWLNWFYDRLGLCRTISFDYDNELQGLARYLKASRPEKFLQALCWWYQHSPKKNITPRLARHIRDTQVLCQGRHFFTLKKSFFPTRSLERRAARYLIPDALFPLLVIEEDEIGDMIPSEWRDLFEKLQVGIPQSELEFALAILQWNARVPLSNMTSENKRTAYDRVLALYGYIFSTCRNEDDQRAAREQVRDLFGTKKCILVPTGDGSTGWAEINECVWYAPDRLQSRFALERIYGHDYGTSEDELTYLRIFFKRIVGVYDFNWSICLEELRTLQDLPAPDDHLIHNLYRALNDLLPSLRDSEVAQIREEFESEELIYIPSGDSSTNDWYSPDWCVWSTGPALGDRVSLREYYETLEHFFVDFLGVRQLDLPFAVEVLRDQASDANTSNEVIKDLIRTVNSLLPLELDFEAGDIANLSIFPVRLPSGSVRRVSRATCFFIPDREPLRRLFQAKLKFLDFSLEEVVHLKPFISWTGLSLRYISECATESTSFNGGEVTLLSSSKRQLSCRAHALLRVAAHFGSPRASTEEKRRSFYEVLQTSRVYEAAGLKAIVVVAQYHERGTEYIQPCEEEKHDVKLHLSADHRDKALEVYLSPDKDDQRYAFNNLLPRKLFEYMMSGLAGYERMNKDGVAVTRDVLTSPLTKISISLEENGISTVTLLDADTHAGSLSTTPSSTESDSNEEQESASEDQYDDEDEYEDEEEEENEEQFLEDDVRLVETASDLSDDSQYRALDTNDGDLFTPTHPLTSPRGHSSHGVGLPSQSDGETPLALPYRSVAQSPGATSTVDTDAQYAELLRRVVEAGRRDAIPHSDFVVPTTNNVNTWRLGPMNKRERDDKVGAAGELYVFEILRHMVDGQPLPDFDRANWLSNVRKHVRVHDDYRDLEPWDGNETSDIVYIDTAGLLTNELIEKGYLDRTTWTGKTPKYFIEVKSTVSAKNTAFYMKNSQYNRMLRYRLTTSDNTDTIYVIFRVYYLGLGIMSLKIYIDSPGTPIDEQLLFRADSWSVVPATGTA